MIQLAKAIRPFTGPVMTPATVWMPVDRKFPIPCSVFDMASRTRVKAEGSVLASQLRTG